MWVNRLVSLSFWRYGNTQNFFVINALCGTDQQGSGRRALAASTVIREVLRVWWNHWLWQQAALNLFLGVLRIITRWVGGSRNFRIDLTLTSAVDALAAAEQKHLITCPSVLAGTLVLSLAQQPKMQNIVHLQTFCRLWDVR